jgi:hypothetical protein
MDLSEQLEQARGVAYDGTLWDVVEMAAREGGEVESYLMHHAGAKFGGGVRRLVSLEALVPWKDLEAWALGLGSYPFAPPVNEPGARRRDEVKAWLNALAEVPSDRGERDWRLLLSGLVWCRNLEDMQFVLEKIIKHCWHDHVLLRVSDTKFDIGAGARCYFYMNDDWKCKSYASLLWGKEFRYGPMGEQENDGTISRPPQLVAIARQLGIEPPARVIAGLGG